MEASPTQKHQIQNHLTNSKQQCCSDFIIHHVDPCIDAGFQRRFVVDALRICLLINPFPICDHETLENKIKLKSWLKKS